MRIIGHGFIAALLLTACSESNSPNQPGTSAQGGTGGSGAAGGASGTSGASAGAGTTSTGGGAGAAATSGGSSGTSGGTGGAPGSGGSVSASGGSGASAAGSVSTGGVVGMAGSGTGGGAGTGANGGTGGLGSGGAIGNAGAAGAAFVQPPLVTSADNAYWVTTGMLTESASGTADVTVNDTAVAHTWEGFGGSFNEKGWAYLSLLSDADRTKALSFLFGRDGCNLTWGRIPMGSSDYANDRYSLDEVASGQSDASMASFTLARDEQAMIPYVKAAQTVKSTLRFWASPWSPPTWMKDGPFNDDSPFDGGSMKTDDTTLGALALYFVKFVQGYAGEGINVEVVSPQNEPGYSGTYPTCAWDPAVYAKFVGSHLAPALSQANLTTKIMLGTFNGGTGDTSIVSTVMGDTTASADIAVLGYQWGMQSNVKSDLKYKLPIWQTEHKCGNYPFGGGPFNSTMAPNDYAYGVESWGLFRDWIKSGVTSYAVWNMVLDTVGIGIDSKRTWPQDAMLTIDTATKTLSPTPAYYVLRHFAQFVQPGAVVLGTTGGDALAFKNPDGTLVTVMYNSGAAKTYVLAVGGKKLSFQMPSGGWATVTQ